YIFSSPMRTYVFLVLLCAAVAAAAGCSQTCEAAVEDFCKATTPYELDKRYTSASQACGSSSITDKINASCPDQACTTAKTAYCNAYLNIASTGDKQEAARALEQYCGTVAAEAYVNDFRRRIAEAGNLD